MSRLSAEAALIARLRTIATHPAARGLADDAAVLPVREGALVLTHDVLVEGVHFLSIDPPETVATKLVAVNLSDLAAKGATPIGALMGYTLTGDADWDARFLNGLEVALARYGLPLLGGDTVSAIQRMMGLTVIGLAGAHVPARNGAQPGDLLYVTGTIGDAGAGLALAMAGHALPVRLLAAYRTPEPQLAIGQRLARHVTAMMDVSDGLLIDARRLSEASGVAITIDLASIPLSPDLMKCRGDDRTARLAAATAGDDYQLLFTASGALPALDGLVTRIGTVSQGAGLNLIDGEVVVPLPPSLGWEHGQTG